MIESDVDVAFKLAVSVVNEYRDIFTTKVQRTKGTRTFIFLYQGNEIGRVTIRPVFGRWDVPVVKYAAYYTEQAAEGGAGAYYFDRMVKSIRRDIAVFLPAIQETQNART